MFPAIFRVEDAALALRIVAIHNSNDHVALEVSTFRPPCSFSNSSAHSDVCEWHRDSGWEMGIRVAGVSDLRSIRVEGYERCSKGRHEVV